MYISKKELLQLTGISYGQLYRWKREGLIPETWFIKKASYTGQETFFPKDKIMERIKSIQELKDRYSLEDLAKILSPDASGEVYISEDELDQVEGINKGMLEYYKAMMNLNELTYYDFILLLLFDELQKKTIISDEKIHCLMNLNAEKFKSIGSINLMLVGIESENEVFLLMFKENTYQDMKKDQLELYFDARMKIRCEISMSELNDEFRRKNKHLFL